MWHEWTSKYINVIPVAIMLMSVAWPPGKSFDSAGMFTQENTLTRSTMYRFIQTVHCFMTAAASKGGQYDCLSIPLALYTITLWVLDTCCIAMFWRVWFSVCQFVWATQTLLCYLFSAEAPFKPCRLGMALRQRPWFSKQGRLELQLSRIFIAGCSTYWPNY